jgi:oligopeptide/dipeptide ABC transporter ATP-binding protein
VHGVGDPATRRERVQELLEVVGLPPGAADALPGRFSGGQRQRINIARALALDPSLVVADEPTSALDVSIQAQIANLLLDIQRRFSLTLLFISHDLSLVRLLSTRVAVMYQGRIVETAPVDELFDAPAHPYTQLLLASIRFPDPDGEQRRRQAARAAGVSASRPPGGSAAPRTGCRFAPRCARAERRCTEEEPALRPAATGQLVACHFAEQAREAGARLGVAAGGERP